MLTNSFKSKVWSEEAASSPDTGTVSLCKELSTPLENVEDFFDLHATHALKKYITL